MSTPLLLAHSRKLEGTHPWPATHRIAAGRRKAVLLALGAHARVWLELGAGGLGGFAGDAAPAAVWFGVEAV